MATKVEYVGELIRKEIKRQRVTNGYVIQALKDAGIEMSDTKFSNKIYGDRDTFEANEIAVIAKKLDTKF